jgi:hypothetical protein
MSLAFVAEDMIRRFVREAYLSRQKRACPNLFTSRCTKIAALVKDPKRTCPNIKKNIFRSVRRTKKDYLF